MYWLKNISIKKNLLTSIFILGSLLIIFIGNSIYTIYQPLDTRAQGFDKANQLADFIISATTEEAKERGFTNGFIATYKQGKPISVEIRSKIDQFRSAGDQSVEQAFKIAEQLVAIQWGKSDFSTALQNSKKSWQGIQNLRQTIDNKGSVTADVWVAKMSEFIESFTNLRQSAFLPANHLEGAIYNNSMIKHAIWAIGEYAGRERAILASMISSSTPISTKKLQTLSEYRGIVEFELAYIKSIALPLISNKKHQQFSSEINQIWTEIQSNFLGSYQQLREQVYQSAKTGKYSITSAQWLSQSTSAINGVLKFNQQVSLDAKLHTSSFGSTARFSFWAAISSLIVALLVIIVAFFSINLVVCKITELKDSFIQVVDNKDVTLRVDDKGVNELYQLAAAFNTVMERMQNLISHINRSSTKIHNNVHASIENTHSSNKGIGKQERDIEQLATAMNEMVASIQSIGESTLHSAKNSSTINDDVKQSGQVMQSTAVSIHDLGSNIEQASEVINQLAKDSQEIGHVLEVIKGIAEQTNLLALNAAIEAARAGEQGRGFAVVADEVRTLAGKTHESTEDIQNMIERLQTQSQKATNVMKRSLQQSEEAITRVNDADQTLTEIITSMTSIMDMNNHIAIATEQQGSVADEINNNVSSLQMVAEDNRGLSQKSFDSMSKIADEMQGLVDMVQQYKNIHDAISVEA